MQRKNMTAGVLLVAVSAAAFGIMPILAKLACRTGASAQTLLLLRFSIAAAAVFGVINGFRGFSPPTGAGGWAATLAIALFCTALAVWAFFAGMAKTGPTATSLVSTLEPVVTVLASALLLSERITAAMIVGGCLVLASLLIIVFAEQKT